MISLKIATWTCSVLLIAAASSFGQARFGQPAVASLPPPQAAPAAQPALAVPMAQAGPDQFFRLESETKLRERMTREYLGRGQKNVLYPADGPELAPGQPTAYQRSVAFSEQADVGKRTLYFDQTLSERYGIYCPLAQPFLATSLFYVDTCLLPLNMVLDPHLVLELWGRRP